MTQEWKNGRDIGLLILRIVFGFVLIYGHGWEKLTVILGPDEIQFFDPIGIGAKTSFILAGFAEAICAALLILGLFSRFATIILVLNFIVIVIFHAFIAKDGFDILEVRIFYLFTFIVLLISGPGKLSLDYILFGKK